MFTMAECNKSRISFGDEKLSQIFFNQMLVYIIDLSYVQQISVIKNLSFSFKFQAAAIFNSAFGSFLVSVAS